MDIMARSDQAGTDTPYNSYNLEDMAKTIDFVYNNLPDDLKLVLKLRDIDDMTYDSIALETNLPIGTVRSKLHRARELLSKTIKKDIEDE
ncbi:MAG: ECF RNA polymerase sigma-E factor [Gammaproteobacteria bacterium]|nr:MAG: ECF RNA polymerase sigma-E factor [Gammaproteobacteria bacterium]